MTVYTDISKTYSLLDLGFDKSLVKPDTLLVLPLPDTPEMQNAFSFGVAGKTITGGELVASLEQQAGVLFSGKTGFNNTEIGYRLGVDSSDGLAKFYIGNTTSYINWTGTSLSVVGGVSIDSIDIGGSDATSFHVDTAGNMWLGAAAFASGPFRVSNAGAITSTSGAIGGWTIGANALSAGSGATTVGFDTTATGADDIRIYAGDATPASAPFRVTEAGVLTATSGTIGGWTISATRISAGTGAATVGLDSTVTGGDDIRIFAGSATMASAPFRVTEAGVLTAASGTIGGWTIGANALSAGSGATTVGFDTTATGADDIRIYAGDATPASAPFRVTEAGAVTGSNMTITGGDVAASVLSGTISSARLNVADRGWKQTCVFSVTDLDTVSWGAGSFIASDGTTYAIGASNTGNMAAKTYVYLDTAVSTTAYQTTTTASTAVGAGKVLVAIAQNGASEANFMVMNDDAMNIDASNIVALSITANEIAASTITSGKLSVSQLSAIAADMGNITAGTIVMPSGGLIRSGQTAFDTGTGFYLGNDVGTPRFSVGNASADKMTWDGTTLTIQGSLTISTTATAGESLAADDVVYIEDSSVTDRTLFTTTATTSNDSYFGRDTIANPANQGRRYAQTINESTAYIVSKLTVSLAKTGAPADSVRVGIQADSGGVPSGSFLASATLGAGSIGGTAADYTFTLSSDVSLTASTTYWIVWERTGALSDTAYYNVYGASSNAYAGGAPYYQNASDVWVAKPDPYDLRVVAIMTPVQGRVYRASADAAGTVDSTLGFVTAAVNPQATATIQTHGTYTALAGLTVGSLYYVSNTLGAISTTPGTVSRKIGISVSATNLVITNIW